MNRVKQRLIRDVVKKLKKLDTDNLFALKRAFDMWVYSHEKNDNGRNER